MSRWLNRKLGTQWRPDAWALLLGGSAFFLLLFSLSLIALASLTSWDFSNPADYIFDSSKVEVRDGLAKLKPVPPSIIHDEESEFSGTHSSTQWATDHIELDTDGLSTGSGIYISQPIDSGVAGMQWGKLSWSESLAQGTASFNTTEGLGVLSTGRAVYGADIDGDDDIDVVAVQAEAPSVLYFENNGAEILLPRVIGNDELVSPADPHVADINKDGRLDVVAIGSSALYWFENSGGTPPTWNARAIATTGISAGAEVEVADVNGDGNLDVAVGDDTGVKWYENNGANPPAWTARVLDSTLSAVDALSTGDLDGDGDVDLLAGDKGGLYWYENNGADPPLFTRRSIDATIVNAESIIAADLNNDGNIDVVGVGLGTSNLSWYENNGESPPGFTKRTIDSGPLTSPVSVAAGDIDRDGNVDLVLVDGADLHWYRSGGGALPTWTKATVTRGKVSGGDHLFLVNLEDDVNGDDDLDIVVAEKTQASWWENLLPHSNIRFQLRTSSDGTSWSDWQGPGGRTTSSYSDPKGETITVPDGRYIQYQAFLRTHNSKSLNAQLSMVQLDPANQTYPKDSPAVQNVTGQTFSSISSFRETLGEGNQGLVRYQISNDGTAWYYYNGSLWVAATAGLSHTNSAEEVSANIAIFDNHVGAGAFYFKALLNSDGEQQVELGRIDIDFSTTAEVAATDGAGTETSGSTVGGGDGASPPSVAKKKGAKKSTEIASKKKGPKVTPKIISARRHFKLRQDVEIDFEYLTKQELKKHKKWKQEYEVLEQDTKQRKERLKQLRKLKRLKRQKKKFVKATETIEAFVFDHKGRLTDIEGEIEELREGRFKIKLARKRARRPGKYNIKVRLVKDGVTYVENQEFTWGVLALNVNKSIYLPSEKSLIGIGVLDDEGRIVCDASVTLVIINPSNQKTVLTTASKDIKISPECSVLGVTELADYYTDYNVGGVGTYSMALTAVTANGTKSIEDSFTVASSVDFDVERDGPTRIYPLSLYKMKFTVKANKNFNGEIKEYVPAGFVITPQEGLTVTTVGDAKLLSWRKDLFPGETYNFDYEFDAPDISPEFYLLGALEIGEFKELRQWQIANDAPVAGEGHVVWGNATTSFLRDQQFSGTTFSNETTVTIGGDASAVDIEASPTVANRLLRGVLDVTAKDVQTSIFDHSTGNWTEITTVTTTASNALLRNFDIEFENSTGDALIVYTDSGAGHLHYRTMLSTESDWSVVELNLTDAAFTGTPRQIIAKRDPDTDDIMVAWEDSNLDVFSALWDGSSFGSVTRHETASGSGNKTSPIHDIAWEGGASTSEALIVWVDGSAVVHYNTWTGGVWGTPATVPNFSLGTAGKGFEIIMSQDWSKAHRKIGLVGAGGNGKTYFANIWDGSAWGNNVQITSGATANAGTIPHVQPVWQKTTGNLFVPWIEKTVAGVRLRIFAVETLTWGEDLGPLFGGAAMKGVLRADADKNSQAIAIVTGDAMNVTGTFGLVCADPCSTGAAAQWTTTTLDTVTPNAKGPEADIVFFDGTIFGSPASLAFSVEPTDVPAGSFVNPAIKVEVKDANGNLVQDGTDSITLAIGTNPASGTPSGTLTVAAVNGVATFSDISINNQGVGYTLTASSGVLTGATSATFDVVQGATKVVFTVQPSNAGGGEANSPAIQVEVRNGADALVTAAVNPITLSIGTNPSGGTPSGTLTVAAVNGVATFSDISIDKLGTGYTLVASATGLTSDTSTAFNIVLGSPAQLAFNVEPSNAAAGVANSPAIKVEIQDGGGNFINTATNAVTLAIDTNPPGDGSLSGTFTSVAAVAGIATFSDISIDKSGTGYTLKATGLTTDATSAGFNITGAAADHMVVTASSGAAAPGGTEVLTLQLYDQFGNTTNGVMAVTVTTTLSSTFSASDLVGVSGIGTNSLTGTLSASGGGSVTITDAVSETVTVSADTTEDAGGANVDDTVAFIAPAAGDGRVIFGDDGLTNFLYDWDFSGTTFGTEKTLALGALAGAADLEASPTKANRLLRGVVNQAANKNLQTSIFDFASGNWTEIITVTTSASSALKQNFDIEFEQSTGDALIVYTDNTAGNLRYRTMLTTESDWSTEQTLTDASFTGTPQTIIAKRDPDSDDIMVAWEDSGTDVFTALWNGSSFGSVTQHETSAASEGKNTPVHGIAWEGGDSTSEALIVWVDSTGTPKYNTWTSGAWGTAGTVPSFDLGAAGAGKGFEIKLSERWSEEHSRIAVLGEGGNAKLYKAAVWDGSAWGNSVQMSTTQTNCCIIPYIHPVWQQTTGNLFVPWIDKGAGVRLRIFDVDILGDPPVPSWGGQLGPLYGNGQMKGNLRADADTNSQAIAIVTGDSMNVTGTFGLVCADPCSTGAAAQWTTTTLDAAKGADTVTSDDIVFFDGPAGAADTAKSLITAAPTSMTTDDSSTITVKLRDANNKPLGSGGDTVVLATDVGSLGSVTDNGNGSYTATLTSTAIGTATITGTVNGSSITDNATVTVTIGAAAGATSLITAAPVSIIADGATTSTITVQLKDAAGNNLTSGGDTVTLAAGQDILSSVTDNSDGTYTATLTSPVTSGVETITGTVNGAGITDNATVTLTPGAAAGATSLITAEPTSIIADGAITSTITVQLRDVNNNNLDSGGDTVVLATDLGSLGSVTDNSDGTYTATLTSTVTGIATITGTVNAAAITDTEAVTVNSGAAAGTTSLITAAPTSIIADGATTSTITVQLKDAASNNLIGGGDTVTLATDLGGLSSVTDVGNGTYTATLTSTVTGTATITGTVNAAAITDTEAVTVNPGAAAGTTSLITAAPTSIVADGATTSTITVQLKDSNSNDLTTGGDTVVLATDLGSMGSVTDNSNGTYTATLTSGTTTGTATITGTVNAAGITDSATVTLTPGSLNATTSLITAAPTTIASDGAATSTITVQLKDTNSNNLDSGGATVTLATNLGSLGSVTDNSDGTYTATLTSAVTPGTATITGTVNGSSITDTATVEFTADAADPATSLVTAAPTSIVADGATTSTITVQLREASSANLTSGGDAVELATDLGSMGSVTDNSDGTYTATLTSVTTAGTATITGTVNAAGITDTATVTLTAGAADATTSLITAAPTSIIADGATTSTITVQLKDANSVSLIFGGDTVELATDLGSLGSVTDNSDGTYTATLTSTTTGLATVTGSVNAAAITDLATVTLIPGAAAGATSLITGAPTPISNNGASTSTITVQLKDATGNNLDSGGDTVVLVTDLGSLGSVTDNSNGTYTATLTSSTTAGTATITGTVNGAGITDNTTVTFTSLFSWGRSVQNSTASPASHSRTMAGTSPNTDNMVLKSISMYFGADTGDVRLAVYTGGTLTDPAAATLLWDAGTVNPGGVAGLYTITHPSVGVSWPKNTVTWLAWKRNTSVNVYYDTDSSAAGDFQTARGRNDNSFDQTPSVAFPATYGETGAFSNFWYSINVSYEFGLASTATSTITAAPTSIIADGATTSTITVQLKDVAGGNFVSGGDVVELATDLGSLGSVTDNSDGTYTATLTSTTTGTATITGDVNSAAITDNAVVTVNPGPAAGTTSLITAAPASIVADGATTSTIPVQRK
ncbi:MAG: VCBS repeat-containing protein, partial [Deltaproteobacteria bacterium]|nr:VCBS repeat-containing protein [Deltaproteobacteria bacterium]